MIGRGSLWSVSAVVAGCLLPLACGPAEPPAPAKPSAEARAKAALVPLKQQLMGELTRAMADAGPAGALDVCRLRAQEITGSAASEGLRLGRTSHRLRNPANAPQPWMEPLLAEYVANPGSLQPRTVRLDPETVGYVEPITIQPPCLACHGTQLDAAVRQKLAELYPEDRATGFAPGELRGMFWVTVPEATQDPGS